MNRTTHHIRLYAIAALAGVATLVIGHFIGRLWNDADVSVFNPVHDSLQSGWATLLAHFIGIPVLMAGLSLGFGAAVVATVVAAIGIQVLAPPGVGFSLVMLLWLLHFAPALYLVWHGLRFEPPAKNGDAPEFYPLGQIMQQISLGFVALFAVLCIGAEGYAAGLNELLVTWLQNTSFTPAMAQDLVLKLQPVDDPAVLQEASFAASQNMSELVGSMLIGLIGVQAMLMLLLQSPIAHSSLLRAGKMPLRPSLAVGDLRLSRWYGWVWIGLWFAMTWVMFASVMDAVQNPDVETPRSGLNFIIINLSLIFMFLPLVTGLDLLMKFTARRKWGWGVIVRILIIALVLMVFPIWLLALLGGIEAQTNWRDRQVARLAKLEKNND